MINDLRLSAAGGRAKSAYESVCWSRFKVIRKVARHILETSTSRRGAEDGREALDRAMHIPTSLLDWNMR